MDLEVRDISGKRELIENALTTDKGRRAIVQAMQTPIERHLAYKCLAHKVFAPFPLDNLPTDDDKWDDIGTRPEIPRSQLEAGRFDLIERGMDLARAACESALAAHALDLLRGRRKVTDAPVRPVEGGRILMNARDYAAVRMMDLPPDELELECVREIEKTGLMSTLWGAHIIMSRLVEPGTVYSMGPPDTVGHFTVELDLAYNAAEWEKARLFSFEVKASAWFRMVKRPQVTVHRCPVGHPEFERPTL